MSGAGEVQFHEWTFDRGFAHARCSRKPPVSFTRQEQAILAKLAGQPGQLISREQLLDALDPDYDGVGPRSVDFVINRLRRKLGDDARSPRFIATRYGEGYIWLVKGRSAKPARVLLSIDAIFGLTQLMASSAGTAAVQAFASKLLEQLQDRCVLPAALSLANPTVPDTRDARFRAEMSVLHDATHLHVSIGVHDSTDRPVRSFTRHVLLSDATDGMRALAGELISALWSSLVLDEQDASSGPTQQPLYLRAHEASLLISKSPEYWLEMEESLLRDREQNPDDPRHAILWASNRHARLLLSAGADEATTTRLIDEYRHCVETQILGSLPALRPWPAYQLTAAMLILKLAGDHDALVDALIDEAFWNGGPFVSVFCVRAVACQCRGDLAQSISYLDRAIEMSKPGSEFHVYLLVLKLAALVAGGNRKAAREAELAVYATKPSARMDIGLQAADPSVPLSEPLRHAVASLGMQRVRQLLRHYHYIVVRPMKVRAHRLQLMLGAVTHARQILGEGVVAEEITADLPELAASPMRPAEAPSAA